jgi:Ca2+-binding EF-hand superfamily protein
MHAACLTPDSSRPDKDGFIDRDELFTCLLEVEIEVSPEIPDMDILRYKVASAIGTYHQGRSFQKLDFLSFCNFAYKHPEVMGCVTMIREFFKQADTDDDGLIDRDELMKLIKDLSHVSGFPLPDHTQLKDTVNLIFETFDTNKDGFIDFPEFTKYYLSKPDVIPPTIPCFTLFVLGPMTPIGFENSLLHELLMATDQKGAAVEIVTCTSCNSPLVGKDGIQKFGLPFCSTECLSSFNAMSGESLTAAQRRKYDGNYRTLTFDDYGWTGVGSKRLKTF